MSPFDVILFDVGGVLLTNGWDHCERGVVLDQFGLDYAEFEQRHARSNDAWERGLITAREYLDATVFYQSRDFTHEQFLEALLAESVELEDGGIGILQELAASGMWLLGCLNNEAREPNEYRFKTFGLREYFDVAFSSCYVGLRKPDAAIYRRTLDVLGTPPGRVLFVDDREANVSGAVAAGMKGIVFEGAGRLRVQLAELGVIF